MHITISTVLTVLTVLYGAVQSSVMFYNTVQCNTVQCSAVILMSQLSLLSRQVQDLQADNLKLYEKIRFLQVTTQLSQPCEREEQIQWMNLVNQAMVV